MKTKTWLILAGIVLAALAGIYLAADTSGNGGTLKADLEKISPESTLRIRKNNESKQLSGGDKVKLVELLESVHTEPIYPTPTPHPGYTWEIRSVAADGKAELIIFVAGRELETFILENQMGYYYAISEEDENKLTQNLEELFTH